MEVKMYTKWCSIVEKEIVQTVPCGVLSPYTMHEEKLKSHHP